jgi:hypothetical protein
LGIGGVREVGECEDKDEMQEMGEAELHGRLKGLDNLGDYLGWKDLI